MSSCSYSTSTIINSPLMTQSLDPVLLSDSFTPKSTDCNNSFNEKHQNGIIDKCLEEVSSPLQALSKLVPVPESLMSPDYRPSPLINRIIAMNSTTPPTGSAKIVQPVRSPKPSRIATVKAKAADCRKSSPLPQRKVLCSKDLTTIFKTPPSTALKKSLSSEDESEICASKLQTIHMKAEERRNQRDELNSNSSGDDKFEQAAIYIQKMWRGYHTRNRNSQVQELFKNLQVQRANQYIQKLSSDMASTKIALESERKIQMLQMQAINALWKKVSTLQPEAENSSVSLVGDNKDAVKDLTLTCNLLQSQIQQLQMSMQDVIRYMSVLSQVPINNQSSNENAIATQTEIIAVHTPQGEAAKLFPFQKQTRPSSLPLPVIQRTKQQGSQGSAVNQELKQFAGSLVEGVIKTVSETKPDFSGSGDVTDNTVTEEENVDESSLDN